MTKQTQLLADKLKQDPRLAEAKRLILETVAEHQQTIQSVRPANPDLAKSYEEMLEKFGSLRNGRLFFDYLSSGFGNGPFCLLYTSPSPRDKRQSRMPSSA